MARKGGGVMGNRVAGMTFIFVLAHLFSALLDGGSGINTTTLSSQISAASLFMPIVSSAGFPPSGGRMFLDAEEFRYDSIQSAADANCPVAPCLVLSAGDRCLNDTDALQHAAGAQVNTELTGILNKAVGFQVPEFSELGFFDSLTQGASFITGIIGTFIAKVAMWDYSFLAGNAVYIKYTVLYPLSAAFVFTVIAWVRNAR